MLQVCLFFNRKLIFVFISELPFGTVRLYQRGVWDSNPYSGMVRLQGSNYTNKGRVEVYCNGRWGTICDDGFGNKEAQAICKQLGYSNFTSYNHIKL